MNDMDRERPMVGATAGVPQGTAIAAAPGSDRLVCSAAPKEVLCAGACISSFLT
jgi:hypothetical protein